MWRFKLSLYLENSCTLGFAFVWWVGLDRRFPRIPWRLKGPVVWWDPRPWWRTLCIEWCLHENKTWWWSPRWKNGLGQPMGKQPKMKHQKKGRLSGLLDQSVRQSARCVTHHAFTYSSDLSSNSLYDFPLYFQSPVDRISIYFFPPRTERAI